MTDDLSAEVLLEVRDISKRFPGVQALRGVRLDLRRGEVLAVIGENGAGKSTMMKILAGIQTPDSGQIIFDGQNVVIDSVRKASDLGIALIHQELNLADNLDIGANIFLGREPRCCGLINRKQIDRESTEILRRVGLDFSPRTPLSSLSIGHQQMVEIGKALSSDARVLIMDEPTSSLSAKESRSLFAVINDLQSQGVSIVYISHRLGEVVELADRVTVLRDGKNVGHLTREEITHDRMVQMMVGRDISKFYSRKQHTPGKRVLEVQRLRVLGNAHHPLSFSVHSGEIVGVAGLVGSGRTEMLQALFGIDPTAGGTIRVGGEIQKFGSPREAIRSGIALVPEDRKHHGLIVEMAVDENMSLAGLNRHAHLGMLNRSQERQMTAEMTRKLRIVTPNAKQPAQFLSGGNQQKIVLGKWLALGPRVLLLDEPTRGIDIGAKQEIYRIIEQLAADGVAILFVSSEMEEILGMSDRTLVMHEGHISGELSRDQLSEEAVMQLATGGIVAV